MAKKVSAKMEPTLLHDFISKHQRATGYVYRAGLLDFLDFINGTRLRGREATPADIVKYEALAAGYISDKTRKHTDDVIRYAKNLRERGIVPKTAHVRIAAVREWLLRQGIELSKIDEKDLKNVKPKGGRRTNFEYIDRKNLAEILCHFDARGRAWALVLASSGMRIEEVLAIQWADVTYPDRKKYPDKPTSIFIDDPKTGNSRTTFISREAEAALIEWQKICSKYRAFATKRSENLKNENKLKRNNDDRVFPFSRTSCYNMWNDALEKAGHYNRDIRTHRVRMNIHRLRNFFSVQAAPAAGEAVSETLLGHSDKYDRAYSGQSQEALEEAYRKVEPAVTIGSVSAVTEMHTKELNELKKENARSKEIISVLQARLDAVELGRQIIQGTGDQTGAVGIIRSVGRAFMTEQELKAMVMDMILESKSQTA